MTAIVVVLLARLILGADVLPDDLWDVLHPTVWSETRAWHRPLLLGACAGLLVRVLHRHLEASVKLRRID